MDDRRSATRTRARSTFFQANYGESSAGLTILRRGKRLYHRVIAQSPVQKLGSYFGQKVQFPLDDLDPGQEGPGRRRSPSRRGRPR